MRDRLRASVIPAYVLLCLLLGGSAQGIWRNSVLQIIAVGIIGWAALSRRTMPLTISSRLLLILAVAGIFILLLQLLPMPPALWATLPGRDLIAEGYGTLGFEPPWLPISLTPYETLATSLTLLPPLAVLLGMLRLGAYEDRFVAGAVIVGVLFHVLLGAVQSVGGGWPDAWWYLYENTNPGAVGFFANRNHMGTLLLIAIPFVVAMFRPKPAKRAAAKYEATILGVSLIAVILVGLALNQSLAAVMLVAPVTFASVLLLPRNSRNSRLLVSVLALLVVTAIVALTSTPVRSELAGVDTTSFEVRSEIWSRSWRALADFFPIGSGIGSYQTVYPLYEDPTAVGRTYVNHAHNDYLQIVVEAGVAGLLLVVAFFTWWSWNTFRIWRLPSSSAFAKAATIASGAILAHSVVDYPGRTAAIAAVLAACSALMARPNSHLRADPKRTRAGARHFVIG